MNKKERCDVVRAMELLAQTVIAMLGYEFILNELYDEYSDAAKHLNKLCEALPDRAWIM